MLGLIRNIPSCNQGSVNGGGTRPSTRSAPTIPHEAICEKAASTCLRKRERLQPTPPSTYSTGLMCEKDDLVNTRCDKVKKFICYKCLERFADNGSNPERTTMFSRE